MTTATTPASSPERDALNRFVVASTKAHLTAAVVAVLEYSQYTDDDRPSMWPYAEDLWTWICGQPEVARMILCQQMLGQVRTLAVDQT